MEAPMYRNQSIDLLCKSMDWFPYNKDLLHKRVNDKSCNDTFCMPLVFQDLLVE